MIYCANKNHPIQPMYFILTILLWLIMMAGCAQSPVSQTLSESVPEPPVVKASAPPQEPILRMETGMHTAGILRIGMDAAERYLATCSLDKTVRVWDVASGHLVRTLRPPIDQKEDGQLYAVAVSPDARIIATGGWTGRNWGDSNSIYLFDLETGKLIRLITGIPCNIFHLSFSLDGRFMAVCLVYGKGVQVYETTTWSLSAWDKQYGDQSDRADFDTNGRMVTTSSDGYIRLYDSSFQRIAKVTAPGGKRPYSAIFSPDGLKIAVGYKDTNKVDILSAKDLTLLYQPDVTGVSKELISVCWSTDGQFLYAAGRWADSQDLFPIRKWSLAGKGSFTDQTASRNTIQNIHSLKNGGIIYGASDPAFGVFDSDGNRSLFVSSLTANFMGSRDFFHISPDGSAVQFCFEQKGKRPAQFSIPDRTLTLYSEYPPENPKMISPHISTFSLSITDWKNNYSPKLNGNPLKLKKYERSRSLAIAPDNKSFLLGAEWTLYRFDNNGNVIWKNSSPSVVRAVNITEDGLLAVVAIGDGTIRWYRMTDGKELLALFPHNDGRRWVLWTPSGYYAASPGAEDMIGWHRNNGADREADFFPCAQFRSIYARPDVIDKVLSTRDETEALRLANEESGRKQQEVTVNQMLPPVVTIQSPKDGFVVSSPEITLGYTVKITSGEPITQVKILIDGRLVTQERGVLYRPPSQADHGEATHDLHVRIPEQDCEVSLIAENRFAASTPATVKLVWQGKSKPVAEFAIKPKLYVLAIGVGKYRDAALKLEYPAKDANDLAAVLEKQSGRLYREVVSRVVTNEKATREGVLKGLEWIEKETTSKDVVMIFLAGHGVNDRNGDFHFIPHDGNPEQLRSSCVPYSILRDTVTRLPGKVIFFLDTCHSGNVMGDRRSVDMGDLDRIASDLASAENGVVVFTSSTGRQYALESPKWNNGAFTKALVEGLDGKAEYEKKGYITINMLDLYVSERVKELTQGQQTPMSARPKTIRDFPIATP